MTCNLHNTNAAICSSCKHRAYFFDTAKAGELAPEAFEAAGFVSACDFCGRQIVSAGLVEPFCMCFRCQKQRRTDVEFGIRTNAPFVCSCPHVRGVREGL